MHSRTPIRRHAAFRETARRGLASCSAGLLITSWSKTQATVAKSSAESKLYGIVRTTCESLGFVTLLEDLGMHGKARLHMDATSAQGFVDRHRISKMRHLDVNVLWLQEQLAKDAVPLSKVLVRKTMRFL